MAKTRTVHLAHTLLTYDFPVNPKDLHINDAASVARYNILQRGESSVPGYRQLKEINFTSFIPAENSVFIAKNEFRSPSSIITSLIDIQNSRESCRIVIGRDEENGEYFLTNVQRVISEGDKDIGVTLSFLEDRAIDHKQAKDLPISQTYGTTESPLIRTDMPKNVLVQAGESVADKLNKSTSGGNSAWETLAKVVTNQIETHGDILDPLLKEFWRQSNLPGLPDTKKVEVPYQYYTLDELLKGK